MDGSWPERAPIPARKLRRAWARGVMDGILSQLSPGDVVVDCGANVGDVAVPLAETGATVIAFEPDPVAFATLAPRLAGYPNALPVPAAVGRQGGRVRLRRSTRFTPDDAAMTVASTTMQGKRDASADGDHDIDVDMIALPDLLAVLAEGGWPGALGPSLAGRRRRLALLKLDVEGEELSLLPALHQAGLLSRIGCTLVETHQRKFPALRGEFLKMRREIQALYGPRKVNLDWI